MNLEAHGLLAKLPAATRAQVPARGATLRPGTGSASRPAGLQSRLRPGAGLSPCAAPEIRPGPRATRVEGEDRGRPDRLGLPAGRRSGHRHLRQECRGEVARRASNATRRSTRTRKPWSPRSTAATSPPGWSTSTTGTASSSELGQKGIHSSATRNPAPHRDPGSIENVAGAAVLASSKHRAEAERLVQFLSGAAWTAHPGARATTSNTRRGPGSRRTPLSRPSAASRSRPSARLPWGTDQTAVQLIEQAGLT